MNGIGEWLKGIPWACSDRGGNMNIKANDAKCKYIYLMSGRNP
jgi:hypothetical protein